MNVGVAQPSPTKSTQSVPGLALGEAGRDPDLAFAHRLLVRLGGVVAAHLLEIVRRAGAVDDATPVAGRALGLDRADVARRGVSAIDDDVFGGLDPLTAQH